MALAGTLCGVGAALLIGANAANAQRAEALWYARGEASTIDFLAHADQISIVSPQTFTLDRNGIIKGGIDPRIVTTARAKHVKLVPLVMNPGFDQAAIHRVLTVPAVRAVAIMNLGKMCTDHKLDGIQFDIVVLPNSPRHLVWDTLS